MRKNCWYCEEPLPFALRPIGIHPKCRKPYKEHLRRYEAALLRIVQGGKFTEEEKGQLRDIVVAGLIQPKDQFKLGLKIYSRVCQGALKSKHLSQDEYDLLHALQDYYEFDAGHARVGELQRHRTLSAIAEGHLPVVTPTINLKTDVSRDDIVHAAILIVPAHPR